MLRHYDKGPCKNLLGHSRASVIWHRFQVVTIIVGVGLLILLSTPLLIIAGPCYCLLCSKKKSSGSQSVNVNLSSDDEGGDLYSF